MNAPLQAFVLKCPECGAPQPGTTATCTHCKVPLMWAPSRSVGRDDHDLFDVEDEPGTELMVFGPCTIPAGSTQHFQIQPQKRMQMRFLWIHPRCSDGIYISNITLGVHSIGDANFSNAHVSGYLFSRGRGFPLSAETALPGILFQFQVHNRLAHNLGFEAVLRVMPIENPQRYPFRHPAPEGPWGPRIADLKPGRSR